MLVTSRQRLVGLGGAVHVPVQEMTLDQGLDLLDAVLGQGRVAADPDAARHIVALCGSLPLAIQIGVVVDVPLFAVEFMLFYDEQDGY